MGTSIEWEQVIAVSGCLLPRRLPRRGGPSQYMSRTGYPSIPVAPVQPQSWRTSQGQGYKAVCVGRGNMREELARLLDGLTGTVHFCDADPRWVLSRCTLMMIASGITPMFRSFCSQRPRVGPVLGVAFLLVWESPLCTSV